MGGGCFRVIQLIGILALVGSDSLFADESSDPPVKMAGVPAGFQFLLEKQTTAIDVFFGGVYITTTLATYSPSDIEFHEPEEIVSRLNNLLTPQQVIHALTGSIDSHVGEVCYRSTDSDCGKLQPDEVGVIFDEGRFRADLFINPNLLSIQQQDFQRYLPRSESGFSHINALTLLYTGGDSGEDVIALNGQTLLSHEQQRLISSWGYSSSDAEGDALSVRTFYWQMDDHDVQYQAGWFTSEARFLSFLPSEELLGFRYSTSLKARTDLSFTNGTPIQLYLPNRSRINIFKDGRFYSTAVYDPGNQLLDTSTLPEGAYEIEMEIVDLAGNKERVTRFFTKSPRLAPLDQDLYFLEIGDLQSSLVGETFPDSEGELIIQGGYSHRITDVLGINVGMSVNSTELLIETGFYYLDDWFDLEPKILLGSGKDYGYSLQGFGRYQDWSMSYYFKRVWSDNGFDLTEDTFFRVASALKQHQVTLGHPLWGGNLQGRYSISQPADAETSETSSIAYSRPLPFWSNWGRLNFQSEFTRSDKDRLVMFRLDWSWRQDSVYHNANMQLRREELDDYKANLFRAGYSGNWLDEDLWQEDVGLSWHAEKDLDNDVYGVSANAQNYYGSAMLTADYRNTLDGSYKIYSAQVSSSFAGEGKRWGVGGKQYGMGAIVVDVKNQTNPEAVYSLQVNNLSYGEIPAGKRLVIPVVPYQTYDVTIKDVGTSYVSFERPTQTATIYPGNVKAFSWEARSLVVLIGRVVRQVPGCLDEAEASCWDPLIFARARNVNDFAATNTDGYVQTEVYRTSKFISFTKRGEECKVDLSGLDMSQDMIVAEEDLKCWPAQKDEADTPAQ